ncbi:hypothetical protein CFIO01_07809 [Colletotrichum fioriniae PJ7]|uniref:Uncharacterized protein n=1 Tax=Colletotrichum fioriniae PJ7 TaxID=1445577 RepID=A0A010RTA2_9PEZI|nr:hypothetical protein CFIO01_07809 [Colletotrichum fioriniae PJ7]
MLMEVVIRFSIVLGLLASLASTSTSRSSESPYLPDAPDTSNSDLVSVITNLQALGNYHEVPLTTKPPKSSASAEEWATYYAFTPSGNLSRIISKPTTSHSLISNTEDAISISQETSLGQISTSGPVFSTDIISTAASRDSEIQLPSTVDDTRLFSTMTYSSQPTPTSTMTTIPHGLFIQTLANTAWKSNTWITTTASDGSPTVIPVLVGCPSCGVVNGGGILLWNLPNLPHVSFKIPGFPNLPQFSLSCIQILGMQLGACPGPVSEDSTDGSEEGDEDGQSSTVRTKDTPSKTELQTSTTMNSPTSQSCTITSTASHCIATCSPRLIGTSSTITCFTTACHETIIGCSVTGTTATRTKQPCPTGIDMGPRKRAMDDDETCDVVCPDWRYIHDPELDDLEEFGQDDTILERTAVAGRILMPRKPPRARPERVEKIGECEIKDAWPRGNPVTIPSYSSGIKFVEAEKAGFPGVNEARRASSLAVPRWYSTTTIPAPVCTAEVVLVDVEKIEHWADDSQRPSLDHVWEKSWLTKFLASTISNDAASLQQGADGEARKMTCNDFKRYIFNTLDQNGVGTQNLLHEVYKSLPSHENVEFVGMIQELNGNAKGLLWDEDRLKASMRNRRDLEVVGNQIGVALNNMDAKLDALLRIQHGVGLINIEAAIELAQKTNRRIYNAFRQVDRELATQNTAVQPLIRRGGFFAPLFRSYMDALLDHPENGIKALVQREVVSMKQNIAQSLSDLDARSRDITYMNEGPRYRKLKTKWDVFQALPQSTWTIEMSWEWPSCDVVARKDGSDPGVCELPQATSTTTSSRTTSHKQTKKITDSPTASKSTMLTDLPTMAPISCGTEDCETISCAGGGTGECLALPMGRGYACGCQPRTWTISHTSMIVHVTTTTTTASTLRSQQSTPPKASSTTLAPAVRWTQSCNVGGLRFDRETATGWVEEFCKDANKKKWSDDKWFSAAVDGKLVKTKGIKVFETDSEDDVSSYKFTLHVVKPSYVEGN